jgi:hypothetical protein
VLTLRLLPKQRNHASGLKSMPATTRATESTYIGGVAVAPKIPGCPQRLLCHCSRHQAKSPVWSGLPSTSPPAVARDSLTPGRQWRPPPPQGLRGAEAAVLSLLWYPLPSSSPQPPPAHPLPLPHPLHSCCCHCHCCQCRQRRCVGDQNLNFSSYVYLNCSYVKKLGSMLTGSLQVANNFFPSAVTGLVVKYSYCKLLLPLLHKDLLLLVTFKI